MNEFDMESAEKIIPNVEVVLSIYKPANSRLSRQINSIISQTNVNIRITSRYDGFLSKELSSEFDFLNLKSSEHLGSGASYMKMICESKSDYLALCDQDDLWLENKLSLQVIEMKDCLNIPLLVSSKFELTNDRGFNLGVRNVPKHYSKFTFLFHNPVPGCTMMINRSAIDLMRNSQPYFLKHFHHDWWLGVCVSLFGECNRVDEPLVRYTVHNENAVGVYKNQWVRFLNVADRVQRGNFELATMIFQLCIFIRSQFGVCPQLYFVESMYLGLSASRIKRVKILLGNGILSAPLRDIVAALIGYVAPKKLSFSH